MSVYLNRLCFDCKDQTGKEKTRRHSLERIPPQCHIKIGTVVIALFRNWFPDFTFTFHINRLLDYPLPLNLIPIFQNQLFSDTGLPIAQIS